LKEAFMVNRAARFAPARPVSIAAAMAAFDEETQDRVVVTRQVIRRRAAGDLGTRFVREVSQVALTWGYWLAFEEDGRGETGGRFFETLTEARKVFNLPLRENEWACLQEAGVTTHGDPVAWGEVVEERHGDWISDDLCRAWQEFECSSKPCWWSTWWQAEEDLRRFREAT
jgi:hypothetical protein